MDMVWAGEAMASESRRVNDARRMFGSSWGCLAGEVLTSGQFTFPSGEGDPIFGIWIQQYALSVLASLEVPSPPYVSAKVFILNDYLLGRSCKLLIPDTLYVKYS